ncbi:hypothetical protein ACWD4T_00555 [Streptomyces umbrinus]
MSTATVVDVDDELIGRCYTKSRRAPLVHGVVRGVNGGHNFRLPFGPYTVTQLVTVVGSVGLLILTRPLWGGHGMADALVLVVVPVAAALALRHLNIDGRNPAAAAASVAVMLTGPRWGRIHGRPLRPARVRHDAPRITLAATPEPASARQPRREPPVLAPGPIRQDPAPLPASPVPMASGVQALLARRAQTLQPKD